MPNWKIGFAPRPTPASTVIAIDWSTRAELLERDAEGGEVGAAAAVLGRERQPEEAEVAHRGDGVDRELMGAIPGLDVRRDLGLGELAHHLAERFLLFAELEVHDRLDHRLAPMGWHR